MNKMKRKDKKEGRLFLGILVAVVALGVGYAAISGVNLLINGSATAKASGQQEDFKVHFDDLTSQGIYMTYTEEAGEDSFTPSFDTAKHVTATTGESNKTASITVANDQMSADVAVSNLTTVGDTVTFTIPVINESDGVKANITAAVTNNNEEYFNVTATPTTATLLNDGGATTNVTVTVSVVKVPKVNDVNGTFTVTLTADPTE